MSTCPEVARRRLTVSGERKQWERIGILRRRTRTVGRFHDEVVLPGDVDDGSMSASMEQGVLTVRVPKPASQRPRRITVSWGRRRCASRATSGPANGRAFLFFPRRAA